MIIMSSEVKMTSTHDLFQEKQLNENLQFWTNGSTNNPGLQENNPGSLFDIADTVDISPQARIAKTNGSEDDDELPISAKDEAKLKLIKAMLEFLTGKEIQFSILKLKKGHNEPKMPEVKARANTTASGQSGPTWGLRYDRVETYAEKEVSTFSAQVQIKTADGREINSSLQVNMSREFISQNEIHLRAGNAAVDPLVINFDGPAAALGEKTFQFDLNTDGQQEQIAFLAPGSGFLALDRNGDGAINDGSELFGPSSGNGFAELASYDEDGNGWIDENDSIYQNLRIWTSDESGNKQLLAIGQKGIGAIYLGHLSSPFSVKDAQNDSLGEVRSSGFFIRENGLMGSMQQVDLVV